MEFYETTETSENLFTGRVISVRRDTVTLSDGRSALREVVDHPGGVVIAALDAQDCIYVVEQFRYPFKEVLTELPAGKLEWGENPDTAAERELREETGLRAQNIRRLGVIYPSPGYCGEKLYLYLATDLTQGQQDLDDGELLRCKRVPLDRILESMYDNTLKDAKTVALLAMVDHLRRQKGITT